MEETEAGGIGKGREEKEEEDQEDQGGRGGRKRRTKRKGGRGEVGYVCIPLAWVCLGMCVHLLKKDFRK